MAKQGRRVQSAGNSRKLVYTAVGAGALIVLSAAVYLARSDAGGASDGLHKVAGFSDVHGLAVNPDKPEEIYVGTHSGLIRGVNGASWARVGALQDDLMGFTMHPTDGSTFWVSGHPRGGGNMGVRQSTDGGFTWTTTWSERVDFHAMTVSAADPDRLWGYFGGQLWRSEDAGHKWSVVASNPPQLSSLATSPTDANIVYAAGSVGVLKSSDGGATWTTLRSGQAAAIAAHPSDASVLVASLGSTLARTSDGGSTWEPLGLRAEGTVGFLAVDPTNPDTLYAATYQTALHKTTDGGATWTQLKAASR